MSKAAIIIYSQLYKCQCIFLNEDDFMAYKVSIIDDDKLIIEGIKRSFDWEKFNCEVSETFRDPVAFYEALKTGSDIDLAFCDIKMPKMDGLTLIEKVRCELKLDKPLFIIISAYSDYEYFRKAINIGVIDYCLKPIDKEETDIILEKAISKLSQNNITETEDVTRNFSQILSYINKNYQEKITLEQISQNFYFNKNYLCFLFKKNLNITFSNYLKKVRLEKAKELLLEGKHSISTIAEKVGYSDYSYFHKSFHQYFGKTPTSFIQHRSNKNGGR